MVKKRNLQGYIDHSNKNDPHIISNSIPHKIKLDKHQLNYLHGDLVEFEIIKRKRKGFYYGKINCLKKREINNYVGHIEINKNFAFSIVENKNIHTDIFIPQKNINGAKNGDKVLIKIEKWNKQDLSPIGIIKKVIGKPGDHQSEIDYILEKNGIKKEFSDDINNYTNLISEKISKKEVNKRKDYRDILTFTIDPEDAKDFDDAISFKKTKNGLYEIGIHIADVSYYVQRSTILDKEAYRRATSIYLVDRVIPMLPEKLSNKICSLRPKEEKLTFSITFNVNDNGEIKNTWIGRTIIKSDHRFSYLEAQEMIETKNNFISAKNSLTNKEYSVDENICEAILTLDKIAKKVRHSREKKGSINFNKQEVSFKLDKDNNPVDLKFKESKDANRLIEEFMLMANKKVAELFNEIKKQKYIFRIHDLPDKEKLKSLKTIIKNFGYTLDLSSKKGISSSLNKLLKEVKGKQEQNLIESLALRSMSKAEYSTNNIGHYGLAFDNYTHFTSPIRRYPDVLVHRLVQYILDKKYGKLDKSLQKKAEYCSKQEYNAVKAERESIKFMQIKFMQNEVGNTFNGIISGVSDWGLYVELDANKCEGMVHVKDIEDDKYLYNMEEQMLIGRATNKKYQLGDKITIKVKKADLIKKHLDFTII